MGTLPQLPAPNEMTVVNKGPDSSAIIAETMAKNGAVVETGTTAVTGSFCAIQVIEEATFSTLTSANWSGDALTSVAIPAGTIIYGAFSAFTLTSGKVIAYKTA